MKNSRKLRIAIDCRTSDAQQGTGNVVLSLAKALSDSQIKTQEYTFVVRDDMREWLQPYIYGPCSLKGISSSSSATATSNIKSLLKQIPPLRWLVTNLGIGASHVPVSDGFVESEHFDVVHFPTQMAYLTPLPTIFQPWDLQHLHYPEFFTKRVIAIRERQYRAFCEQATSVCVQAEWTKKDIIHHLGINANKITVIPWGSVFDAYESPSDEEIAETAAKYGLPDTFFFYPAATWPHKNHEVIYQALHILKEQGSFAPHVFFTGASKEHRLVLDKLAEKLKITPQIHFLGFVSPLELRAIFKSATAMIFPSKFEGFGLPILEAFHAGLPVLSSNATTLPEVAGDGARYFNPDSPPELAALMIEILKAPQCRQDLIERGRAMLSQFSIRDTVANFQALYAQIAESSYKTHGEALRPITFLRGEE